MQKTTAKVEHRDYVPSGWIAIEFCDVHFYGFRAEEMKRKWCDITNKRYDEYAPLYEENEAKIQNMRNQIKVINTQKESLISSKPSKPFYRFWYNKSEKARISEINKLLDELLKQADNLTVEADKLEKENKEIGDKRFFEVYECHTKIETLLQQNGFVLTHTSSEGKECVTRTEVWTLEE